MNNLIERYTYDVIRRLPDNEQEEVRKELSSNIYDMLSDDAGEEEIKKVIYSMGKPSLLAEKYRQNPRYLISPAFYDYYTSVLKWLLPLVGVVVFGIDAMIGVIGITLQDIATLPDMIKDVLTKAISMGFDAVFQAFLWTTLSFCIVERFKEKMSVSHSWKIEDLPETLPNDSKKIALSQSISELVLTVLGYVFLILVCCGSLPIFFVIQRTEVQIPAIFNSEFLISCIPAVIIMALLDIWGCFNKIKARRWNRFVCVSVVVGCLINMCIALYLLNSSNLLAMEELDALSQAMKQDLQIGVGFVDAKKIIAVISTVIVTCSIGECGWAFFKTTKK